VYSLYEITSIEQGKCEFPVKRVNKSRENLFD
jgi:hypothetical protein